MGDINACLRWRAEFMGANEQLFLAGYDGPLQLAMTDGRGPDAPTDEIVQPPAAPAAATGQ